MATVKLSISFDLINRTTAATTVEIDHLEYASGWLKNWDKYHAVTLYKNAEPEVGLYRSSIIREIHGKPQNRFD